MPAKVRSPCHGPPPGEDMNSEPLTRTDKSAGEAATPGIQPFGSVESALAALQAFQQYHDERFHRDVMSWPFEKQLEHVQMHLAKITGLLATVCEKKHHGESNDELAFVESRVADLLVFALKLANLYHLDLEAAYRSRLFQVEQKKLA